MSSDPTSAPEADAPTTEIRRGRTAIHRYQLSRPVAGALAAGLIEKATTFFDYGCGHGADMRLLKRRGIVADGWDPHHRPKRPLTSADVVNLGYVLNVIEDPQERTEALKRAYELARQVLIVAVRVDKVPDGYASFSDGFLTASNTFQKIYTQGEFREYLEATLGGRPHIAGLGVAYVFRSDEAESRYLANRAFSRRLEYHKELTEQFTKSALARRYVKRAQELGRPPSLSEFPSYPKLVEQFGSPRRIERLLLEHVDQSVLTESRAQRREDILTFLAMLRLQSLRHTNLGVLPQDVQLDIKALWPNYAAAQQEGDRFLFSLGQPEAVRAACHESAVGKRLPTDLYVHRSAEEELPALLRVLLFAARRIIGEVEYDLLKVATDGRAISFLTYDNFDANPHPALLRSLRVYLPRTSYEIREYAASVNPPILHRKDTFVAASYPGYALFKQLTEEEERLGLLSQPDIGTKQRWAQCLLEKGLALSGHTLTAIGPT